MWYKFVNLFDSFGKIAAALAAVIGLYVAYEQLNQTAPAPVQDGKRADVGQVGLSNKPPTSVPPTDIVDAAPSPNQSVKTVTPSFKWPAGMGENAGGEAATIPSDFSSSQVLAPPQTAPPNTPTAQDDLKVAAVSGENWKPGRCFDKTPGDSFSETITMRRGEYVLCYSDGTQLAKISANYEWLDFYPPGGSRYRIRYGKQGHGSFVFGAWTATALKLGTSDADYQARLSFTIFPQ